ncbi:hypothetical protein BC829DRAFT_408792 [Chytridium lagenaria]|nr:hypothetical protein BC829DRAFT_408792 [Chytridium lagenaria]
MRFQDISDEELESISSLMDRVEDGLYIGNLAGIRQRGSFTATRHHPRCSKQDVMLKIPIDDHPDVVISEHFERAFEFIEKGREVGKVLHCQMGQSRSATVVMCIKPNMGFLLQLQAYGEDMGL